MQRSTHLDGLEVELGDAVEDPLAGPEQHRAMSSQSSSMRPA
jgi:hypothetical protein